MPRRKRQGKRRTDELTFLQASFAACGPRMTRRDGNDGRAEWKAWNRAHGLAWRFQRNVASATDWLTAFELLTGEQTLKIDVAQREVERLLGDGVGVGVAELGLDMEHPDPPGLEAVRAAISCPTT